MLLKQMKITKRKSVLMLLLYLIWLASIILSFSPGLLSKKTIFPQEIPDLNVILLILSGVILATYSTYLGYQEIK
jgi:hypothetical protein